MPEERSADALIADVEGTIGPVAFVREVLFPYARRSLPDYLRRHADEAPVASLIEDAAAAAAVAPGDLDAVIEALLGWIDSDKKVTPLKALQGMVWQHGYAAGDYRAPVYPDALAFMADCNARGIAVYLYSSGSAAAQRLYCRYSTAGDIRAYVVDYFDTTSGGKLDAASYAGIAGAIGCDPARIVFASDHGPELIAAGKSGLQTLQLLRADDVAITGEEPLPGHTVADSFEGISLSGD
ncbi:MAG: acireductone synthase [Pseudomonadota bacterium]